MQVVLKFVALLTAKNKPKKVGFISQNLNKLVIYITMVLISLYCSEDK